MSKILNSGINGMLVGLDFSSHSKVVVAQAQAMSRALGLPVTYCYVAEGLEGRVFSSPQERQRFSRYSTEDVLKFYKLSDDSPIIISFGQPSELLTKLAVKLKSKLLMDESLVKNFKKIYRKHKLRRVNGSTMSHILKNEKGYDLVVLSPRRERGFFTQLTGVSNRMVRFSERSLLIVKP